MEKSYIKNIDINYITMLGFNQSQINKVTELVNKGINEKLYKRSIVPYHNLKHIEKVIIYSIWILNKKKNNGMQLNNEDILLLAALYHDCGRSKSTNKNHGIIGAEIARNKLHGTLDNITIDKIGLLIETHAKKDDNVDFKDYDYNIKEKENIQMLSDILKDADALDRNRIKLFSFAKCDVSKLRTLEAKEIYNGSDLFLKKYEEAIRNTAKRKKL